MCYSICGCVLTYQKLPFGGAFLTFQNHTQKLRALLTEIQHARCCAPSLRFSSRPRIILPAVGCSTSRWSLSIILFSCSGSYSSCKWQLYIQWLMKVDMRKNSLHSDSRKHRADVRFWFLQKNQREGLCQRNSGAELSMPNSFRICLST